MAYRSAPIFAFWFFLFGFGAVVRADDSAELGEVRVTAPPEATGSRSAFTTVITPREREHRFTTMTDLLQTAAGATVRELAGPGQFSTVSIRGSSAEQVAVYLDGIRLNTGGLGAVDVATLPTLGVGRIEVLRGGGTTEFGSDAVGGVVNLVTRRGTPGRALEASVSGGSFGTVKSGASFAHRTEERNLLLALAHFQSRGNYPFTQGKTTLAGTPVSGGGNFRRDHNRVFSDDLLLRYEVETEPGTRINLTNDFFWTDRQLPGTEAEATLLVPTNPLEASQRIFRNLTHAGVQFDDLWTPRLGLGFGLLNSFEHTRFDDPTPAIGTPINRTAINDAINPYCRWDYTIPTVRGSHLLTLRYDFRRDIFDDAAGNATTTTTGLRERDLHQVLVKEEWAILKDRVTLVAAGRYADANDFADTGSGKLGLAVSPLRPLTIKANLESTHRFPTFFELYYPDEGYLRGNPDLEKEGAVTWDAGATAAWAWGRAEAGYFQQRISNSILFVPISATTIQPINTFAARADGIEASLDVAPFRFLRLAGNYTWLRARFASSGLQLPGRPRHSGTVRGELFRDISPRMSGRLFTDVRWVSRLPVNTANSVFLAGRVALDCGLTATLTTRRGPKYFATLEAKDVTDVQIYDARGFPLPRRSFFITVGAKWS